MSHTTLLTPPHPSPIHAEMIVTDSESLDFGSFCLVVVYKEFLIFGSLAFLKMNT